MRLIDATFEINHYMSIITNPTPDVNMYDKEHARAIVDAFRMAKTVKPCEPQWIPCSERFPKESVLCCDKRGEMIIGMPYKDETSDTGFSAESDTEYLYACVAWMPLPECYKGEEE